MTAYENEDGNNDTEIMEVLDTNVIEDPLDTITKKEYNQPYRYVGRRGTMIGKIIFETIFK